MKHLLAVSLLTGLMSLGTVTAAQAMPGVGPVPAVGAGNITLIAQGCGPGGFRDRFGRCFYRRPPPFRRFCPPGTHPTPVGCRPNY